MSDPTIRSPDAITAGAVTTLRNWSSMAAGAFSANTIRAWKADWEIFVESCRIFRVQSLAATPKTVGAFVFECLGKGKKPATVRSKTDTTGEGATAYLSPLTMRKVGPAR